MKAGPVNGDERVYYLFPVSDLDRIGEAAYGLRQVSSAPATRTVTLRSDLPDPLPDGEPDKLRNLYPEDRQVRLVIRYDSEFMEDRDREAWIRQQATAPEMTPEGDRLLSDAKHRWLSTRGELTLSVAPVDDAAAYRAKITFGDVTAASDDGRLIRVVAKIPVDLAQMNAEKKKAARSTVGGRSDREPADGEARTIWAARVLKSSDDFWARKDAIKHLVQTLPEDATEQERSVVREALTFAMRAPEMREGEQLADLMIDWQPEGYAELIRERIEGSDAWHREKQKLLRSLADSGDPAAQKAAAAAAVAVANETWMGKDALKVIRDLGPVAEDAVLARLTDPKPGTRADIADLLAEIGTEKSAERLLEQSKLEPDRALAKHMRAARLNLKRRLMAEAAGEG